MNIQIYENHSTRKATNDLILNLFNESVSCFRVIRVDNLGTRSVQLLHLRRAVLCHLIFICRRCETKTNTFKNVYTIRKEKYEPCE